MIPDCLSRLSLDDESKDAEPESRGKSEIGTRDCILETIMGYGHSRSSFEYLKPNVPKRCCVKVVHCIRSTAADLYVISAKKKTD